MAITRQNTAFGDKVTDVLSGYRLLVYFILSITYWELLYFLWIFRNLELDFIFAFLFALSAGSALYLLIGVLPPKMAYWGIFGSTTIFILCYGTQLVYTRIFQTPLSLISVGGAGDVLQFWDIMAVTIYKNGIGLLMLLVPLILLIVHRHGISSMLVGGGQKTVSGIKGTISKKSSALFFLICSYCGVILLVSLTGDGPVSQKNLFFRGEASLELSVKKLGILTTMRLDFERLAALTIGNAFKKTSDQWVGNNLSAKEDSSEDISNNGPGSTNSNILNPGEKAEGNKTGSDYEGSVTPGGSTGKTGSDGELWPEKTETADYGGNSENDGYNGQAKPSEPVKPFNIMEIDFDDLLAAGHPENIKAMHEYFSTVPPTPTNKYTGIFKGCNLILLTAESFSPYAMDPVLTPTLYGMATEGFVFENFYNPVWWVSTSDGEYVACTGLIPKGGVWSMAFSGKNHMPFAMGNQFKRLGYITKAYHNHTYTFYKRDISHPNLGYEYKGVGNGLEVKKTWPESDLEMIEVTAGEYIGQEPFHAYYMTVSGHMNYTYSGNTMARKNKEFVEDLPYSEASKAYIACNLELEFAMKALVDKLEEAGIAENTVIALSPDHYPYGLEKGQIDELVGHVVEKNFELYKSTFILWKKGMEPVIVDKPCSSLDIIPTLSNLFGLDYDSRLLAGRDILSDSPPLVIFSNRSWITDIASYNADTNKVIFVEDEYADDEYVKEINKIVSDKFTYSAKILETDYYRKIFE